MSEIKNTSYTHQTYQSHASFVPLLTSKISSLLSPLPTDRIIDLGAGDLILTSKLSHHCLQILALDASKDLITSGQSLFPKSTHPNLSSRIVDCRYLENEDDVVGGNWDKVFSNAALHWILRDPSTRKNTLKAVYDALKPSDGKFIAEMGGFGNISEVHVAITSALHNRGIPLDKIKSANPWFFPSEKHMRELLEETGFEVEMIESEYRPTELSFEDGDGEGGVKAWIQMFGQRFLELVEDEAERAVVAGEARDLLEGVARREDGRWVVGYVRLRWVAVKK
ncbi:hypothetical protein TWF225_011828 [Orbilia oligospora]|uniref:Methyltransferase type 11 domain-containing protein n=1 Tax=Orbilia oligospora TaxID=2813651 RepID=A0A8H2DP45_ORBOL|nr:hypothetical protein TWF225_011828 [Orbilia oligospora]KAF3253339.1 hypothetical protein TWF128_006430 [Orbilia oligospora]KAF3263757.1 hypothetical protein TWF217_003466 [Orbilia oligospora]KAF3297999.1 hypothetical protein TWF132_004144 [Orbilia oligospora]TGJ65015.1 hypothetical protein EYR41_009021 [Orbilia oligospora]